MNQGKFKGRGIKRQKSMERPMKSNRDSQEILGGGIN